MLDVDSSGFTPGVTSSALWETLKTACLHLQRLDLAALCEKRDLEGKSLCLFLLLVDAGSNEFMRRRFPEGIPGCGVRGFPLLVLCVLQRYRCRLGSSRCMALGADQ